jgi:hypothetical protein
MVSFLSPLFLVGFAAAAVPIVLHLLKRRPEPRVRFGAVQMLKRASIERTEKRSVRELILLALRVAALALFAVAFARPFFASGSAGGSGSATIVALDTSYSMSAPGRFARAQQLAKDAISRAATGDPVGVVTFSDEADVVVAPAMNRAVALQAIDRLQAGFGATNYRTGIAAAANSLAGRRGAIVVVTDLQANGWDADARATVPETTRIDVADVGPLPPNFAVTALRSDDGHVVATVRNASPQQRETRVSLAVDGRSSGDRNVSIGPNQSLDVAFEDVARGAFFSVTVADPDGLSADNIRYGSFGDNRLVVLVVTADGDLNREGFYLEQALAARSTATPLYQVSGVSAATFGARPQDEIRRVAAIALLSTSGLDRRGRDKLAAFVRNGGGILIAAGPGVDGDLVKDVPGDADGLQVTRADDQPLPRALVASDIRHPIFEPFGANLTTLALVRFQRVTRISGAGCQAVARFTTGETALLDCPAGAGRALILASDLDREWNDFPLHPSYVPFLNEAVRYLAGQRALDAGYLIGSTGVPRTPGIQTIVTPNAHPTAAPSRVVVNVDPREGEPARISSMDFQSAVTHLRDAAESESTISARRQEEDRQHLWQYVLIMMVVVLGLEGFVASRTT